MNNKEPLKSQYMYIEALEDGLTASLSNTDVEYSMDGLLWETLEANTHTPLVNEGERIYFRGEFHDSVLVFGIGTFTISKKCSIGGNVMSLLYGEFFKNETKLSYTNAFKKLFANCTNLFNVDKKFLPATTLANDCYYDMFYNCTNLVNAPELPATTLANNCYSSMFRGCTSLVNAPSLPATTLADSCYSNMFYGCTGLTAAPALPATTLAELCYSNMFRGCTGLTAAPALPATTLAKSCYAYMFEGCSSLNYIKMLATDISATDCLRRWVNGVSPTGTFVKSKDATWDTTSGALGDNGVPTGWTVKTE